MLKIPKQLLCVDERSETELLISCLHHTLNPTPQGEERIRRLTSGEINWNYFLTICFTHRVVLLVKKCLDAVSGTIVPQPVKQILTDYSCKRMALQNHCIKELLNLLQVFQQNNIPVLTYKGLALALLYDRMYLREWSDIDIIVRKADIESITTILFSNGYSFQPQYCLEKELEKKHSYPFIKTTGTIELDVHWSLQNAHEGVDILMAPLWERQAVTAVFGVQIPVLSPVDMFLSVCVHHGLRNSWSRLIYLYDMAMMITAYRNMDWGIVLENAKKQKIRKTLLVGSYLTQQLFGTGLPAPLEQAISKENLPKKLKPVIYKLLFGDLSRFQEKWHTWKAEFLMREELKAKLILMHHILLTYLNPGKIKNYLSAPFHKCIFAGTLLCPL